MSALCMSQTWTTSNLSIPQTIFADSTFSKPFFVTYFNTSFFISPLIPIAIRKVHQSWKAGKLSQFTSVRALIDRLGDEETRPFLRADGEAQGGNEDGDEDQQGLPGSSSPTDGRLGLRATARLSLQFCLLWVSGIVLLLMLIMSALTVFPVLCELDLFLE